MGQILSSLFTTSLTLAMEVDAAEEVNSVDILRRLMELARLEASSASIKSSYDAFSDCNVL
jgi:hypothetical protein